MLARRISLTLLLATAALACRPPAQSETPPPSFGVAAGGVDWELVELEGAPAPTGAGGRRATLRFDPDAGRVGGFAGCNRIGGPYTVDGPALRFGALAMTKMACDQGMDLEQRLARALAATRRYEIVSDTLTLSDESRAVARFARGAP